jgi:hypothetical protein
MLDAITGLGLAAGTVVGIGLFLIYLFSRTARHVFTPTVTKYSPNIHQIVHRFGIESG